MNYESNYAADKKDKITNTITWKSADNGTSSDRKFLTTSQNGRKSMESQLGNSAIYEYSKGFVEKFHL